MRKQYSLSILAGVSVAALLGTSAQAALVISDKPTSNVTCSAGVCSATASEAVVNVTDLTTMLAAGSLTVQSGSQAQDILVEAPLSWTSSNALTLDADKSLTINKALADAGPAALTLSYGKKGDLRFGPKGNISFISTANSLTINNKRYTLVDSIASLASAVASNPSGLYALAHDYDAKKDGTYTAPPVATPLTGTFEGLGNVISSFSISVSRGQFGFFNAIENNAEVRDFGLAKGSAEFRGGGLLAAYNIGTIMNSFAQGVIKKGSGGGLVGTNSGTIERSHADVTIDFGGKSGDAGGLAGGNAGLIDQSYATGRITSAKQSGQAGGLVFENDGTISNSYATGAVQSNGTAGGLVEANVGNIINGYSTGMLAASEEGGLIWIDQAAAGSLSNTYWDVDTSGVNDPSQGAYDPRNDPGITGLTDAQLKAGLPPGFDPKVWTQDPKVNNGYPFLKENPPAN